MANNEIVKVESIEDQLIETGVDKVAARDLLSAYGMPISEIGDVINNYTRYKVVDEKDTAGMELAREQRLKLKNARIAIKKKHDELKKNILQQGNAIDFVNRTASLMIEPAESYLEAQEKFAETQALLRYEKRVTERSAILAQYVDDLSVYNFGDLEPEEFDQLLETVKALHEAKLAAEQKAREEEQARIQAEEDARKAAAMEDQKRRIVAEKKAKEERAARIKAEADAADARREADKAKADADAKHAAMQKRIDDENAAAAKAKAEETARIKAEQEAAAKAQAAPDKEKLLAYLSALGTVAAPVVGTDAALALQTKIASHFVNTLETYRAKIEAEL